MSEPTMLIKDIKAGMQNVNITGIILEVGNPTPGDHNREIRTLKIADHTACINLVVWNEIGQCVIGGYILHVMKSFAAVSRNCLTLFCTRSYSTLEKVGEFCMLFNENLNMSLPIEGSGSATPVNLNSPVASSHSSSPDIENVPGPVDDVNDRNGTKVVEKYPIIEIDDDSE